MGSRRMARPCAAQCHTRGGHVAVGGSARAAALSRRPAPRTRQPGRSRPRSRCCCCGPGTCKSTSRRSARTRRSCPSLAEGRRTAARSLPASARSTPTARRARRRVAPIRISAARRARKSGSGQALMTHSDPSRDASGVALVTLAAACSCPSLVGRFEPRAPHTQLHGSMGLALARPRPASSGPRQPRSRAELSRASAPGPAQPPVRSLARRARRPATGRHPRALARACANPRAACVATLVVRFEARLKT